MIRGIKTKLDQSIAQVCHWALRKIDDNWAREIDKPPILIKENYQVRTLEVKHHLGNDFMWLRVPHDWTTEELEALIRKHIVPELAEMLHKEIERFIDVQITGSVAENNLAARASIRVLEKEGP